MGRGGLPREINGLAVALALHYPGIRKDTVMNIKALVASLVLGVVTTSSAAMASPFDGRRDAHRIEDRRGFEGRRGFEDHRSIEDRRHFEGRRFWHGPVVAGRRDWRR